MSIFLILISIVSGVVAGMGIGGGSIFILLTTIFNLLEHKQAQGYNLIMFIVVGIATTIYNIKNKNIDFKNLLKLILPVCVGSICGIFLLKIIDEKILKNCFYLFMVIIGFYEIFSSLKNIYKTKNNKKWKEWFYGFR